MLQGLMAHLTYKISGVDIKRASLFKNKIKPLLRKSFRKEVLRDIGGFGSFFAFPKEKYREPILVSSCDGVGTKLKVATLVNKHDTIGIDAVAMNVNDILCVGAKPLFFLDYIAYSKLGQKVLLGIVKGINNGCIQAGASLVGGETAQMPGFYRDGDYDVAGFCVGVVEKKNIIDGSKIKKGDKVIGLASSGLHSNGFSLVRKVFSQSEIKKYAGELLKPTRIYVKLILSLLHITHYTLHNPVKGIAHITGGAFYDKIARILPNNVDARIHKNSWPLPQIFQIIQRKGAIKDNEMYRTFNMGIGLVLIVEPKSSKAIISKLFDLKIKSWVIGEVVRGKKQVQVV